MAKASDLKIGQEVTIISGGYEGHTAIIVDPTPIPDGQENQRKILVSVNGVYNEGDQPFEHYILPRLVTPSRPKTMTAADYYRGQEPVSLEAALMLPALVRAEDITDPMDPALDRFRPNVDVVKKYINRILPGGYLDVDFLLALRGMRDTNGYSPNVALVGETQSGKTMFVQVLAVLAAERDGLPKPYPVFTLSGSSGVTNYDIYGMTTAVIIDGREVLVWMEGLAALAARAGGFLYLDEWNAVNPGQSVALHPLLDDRRQFVNTQKAVPDGHGGFMPETVQAHKDMWIISTINPGYKGVQTLSEATSNRFRWLSWDYDDATEKALVPSKTVRLIGGRLRQAHLQRSVSVPVGTSVLQRLNADCAMFGVDAALWTFQSLFPPNERERVRVIIEDGGSLDLLREEYPEAVLKPVESTEKVSLGNTWST